MLMHIKARHFCRRLELKVPLQRREAQRMVSQLRFEIVGHRCFVILSGGNVERLHHQATCGIPLHLLAQLLPELTPVVIGQ